MRRLAPALAAALLCVACSGAGADRGTPASPGGRAPTTTAPTGPVPSPGCEVSPAAAPGVTDRTIRSAGGNRHFQLDVPEGYDGSEPLPLMLGLHALTVPYTVVRGIYGFDDPPEPVIGVYPSGLLDHGVPFWLALPVAPNRDVRFVDDLLDRLEAELCVDTSRVFSNGMSNGGQMSSLLACVDAPRIAGVALVAGVEFPAAGCDGRPVPVIAFHGDADPIVTYAGGGLNARTIAEQYEFHGPAPAGLPVHEGVDAAMANWAAHNGCEPEPVEDPVSAEVLHRTWTGCEAPTELYVVLGGGHTWPGRPVAGFEDQFGPTTTDVDATALLYDFLLDE